MQPLKRLLLSALAASLCFAAHAEQSRHCPHTTITLLKSGDGGRVDWRPDGKAILADRRNPKTNCFDLYEMDTQGHDLRCLTCGRDDLPKGTKGNPAYHPSGRYIVFQAEKKSHFGKNCKFFTNPGIGEYSDLWSMNLATGKAAPLYEIPNSMHSGTLHPHFSHDGKKLLWSEMYRIGGFSKPLQAGRWALKMADVGITKDGKLQLSNVRTLLPNKTSGEGMAESHGFTPDDRHIVFSGNLGYKDSIWKHNDIFMANPDGGDLKALTHEDYNEHAHFSLSGRHMAWMSARATTADGRKGTEFFLMDAAGTQTCQLSHFNAKGFPESQASTTTAADLSWSPDGMRIAGYSHNLGFSKLVENIWLIRFESPQ